MSIAISGTGVISGAGVGPASLFAGCRERPSNRITIPEKQPPFNRCCQAVSASEFDAAAVLGKKGLQFLTRSTQLLTGAAYQAIREAGFNLERDGGELGLVIGTHLANLATLANYDWTVVSEGPSFVSPMDAPNTLANAPASQLAIRLGAKSVNTTISTGRCASLDAVGYAAHFLEQQRAAAILAGGTEEVNPHVLWQLQSGGIQPHDEIPGEAAAVLLLQLEPAVHSERRRSTRYSSWANSLAPHYSPERLVQEVISEALELASLKPHQIQLVGIDVAEKDDLPLAEGVCAALLPHDNNSRPITAFSLKMLVGQTLGAAGALHAVAAVNALQSKQVPPTTTITSGLWPRELIFAPAVRDFEPGPALIATWDPTGFASALIVSPPN